MDAQRPHEIRIVKKVAIGAKVGGMNAGNRTQIVKLVGIASDPDGAQDFAGLVADQLAAAFQKQRVIGEPLERLHE